MIIKKASKATNANIFIQKNSVAIRIWHWLTFLIVISLFVTVLMASTALNPRKNIPVVQDVLKEKGVIVNNDQAWAVSHMYDDKMWDFHKLLGYALSFLVLSRMLIELTQPKEEKMRLRLKKAFLAYRQPGADKKELRHYLLMKVSYILFYLLIFCMVITGLTIAFGAELGLAKSFRHTVKEVHGFIQYLIYAFVAIHLAGVILADMGKSKGVISGMVNGGE